MKLLNLLICFLAVNMAIAQNEIKEVEYLDQKFTIALPVNAKIEIVYTGYNGDGSPRLDSDNFIAISLNKENKLSDIFIKETDLTIAEIKEATETGFFKNNIVKVHNESDSEVIYEMKEGDVTYYQINGFININGKKHLYQSGGGNTSYTLEEVLSFKEIAKTFKPVK